MRGFVTGPGFRLGKYPDDPPSGRRFGGRIFRPNGGYLQPGTYAGAFGSSWGGFFRANACYLSGKLYYFDIGDTSRFLKVYQYTTELGEILQDHLDAWSIDEKNQLIFEDESVMDQYNTVFFEMQRLLQDEDGSALA